MADDPFSKHIKSRNFVVSVKLDTSGRKGKTVTLLDGLPKQELFLKDLVKTLKQACGAGGTHLMDRKEGAIELQGDHRDRVCKFLEQHSVKTKR
jgi:translation initiation factor 1